MIAKLHDLVTVDN